MFRLLLGAVCATMMLPALAQAATVVPVRGIVSDQVTLFSSPQFLNFSPGNDQFVGAIEDLAVSHASTAPSYPGVANTIAYQADVSARWDSETEGSVTFDTSFTATIANAAAQAGVGGTWAYIFEIDEAETIVIDYETVGFGAYSSAPALQIYLSDAATWDDLYRVFVSGTGSLTFNLGPGRYQFAALNAGSTGLVGLTGPGTVSGSQAASLNWRIGQSAAPEPTTWVVMLLGFGAVGAMLRRAPGRQRAASRALA